MSWIAQRVGTLVKVWKEIAYNDNQQSSSKVVSHEDLVGLKILLSHLLE